MTDVNPADIAALMDAANDEAARQAAIVRARKYHAGDQFVRLDARLRAYLKDTGGLADSDALRLNVCRTVVSAVVERLIVAQVTSGDAASAQLAADIWRASRMDAMQDDVHEATVRDGESFLVLGWDAAQALPVMVPHPRYTATDLAAMRPEAIGETLTGDGYGVRAFYPDDDDTQPMLFASKQWTEVRYDGGKRTTRRRLTVYHPDRIERYVRTRDWELLETVPWLDRQRLPLGIPVVHVRNPGLHAEAWDAIPLQNAINKLLIDLMTASDMTAFRILAAFGWIPTTDGAPLRADGANALTIEPGAIIGSASKDGSLTAIDGADLAPALESINSLIAWTAMVTDTPVSRFVFTRAVASAASQKEGNAPLLNKVQKRQTLIGDAYADAMGLARRMAATFGRATDSTAPYRAEWRPAEEQDEEAEMKALRIKRELGVPQEQLWIELGYSQEQIAQWRAQAPPPASERAIASEGAASATV